MRVVLFHDLRTCHAHGGLVVRTNTDCQAKINEGRKFRQQCGSALVFRGCVVWCDRRKRFRADANQTLGTVMALKSLPAWALKLGPAGCETLLSLGSPPLRPVES